VCVGGGVGAGPWCAHGELKVGKKKNIKGKDIQWMIDLQAPTTVRDGRGHVGPMAS
jgi:hypothetical protein